MENATKALIIAGAVLISILLISVGIMVFNSASDPINQAGDSSAKQAIQIFNESFSPYLGNSISAQQAKSLISAINSNKGNTEHPIDTSESKYKTISSITTGKRYSAIEGTDDAGYINKITIGDEIKE